MSVLSVMCEVYCQVSGSSPVSSPHSSPVASRRSPNSYRVTVSDRHLRRERNGDKDSGVYSANSSRDGTPVRGTHTMGDVGPPAGGVGTTEVIPRVRSRAVKGRSSPKHRPNSSGNILEQNGVQGTKYNKFNEVGEGTLLEKSISRGRIDPVSLNLVSKSIEPLPEHGEHRSGTQKSSSNGSDSAGGSDWANLRVKRSSSDRPRSPGRKTSAERESKSLSRGGNKIRAVSPSRGADCALDSPGDIKLVSKVAR